MISIEDVSFHYPGTTQDVLDNVTLSINDGEFVAIMGENGAGKTTLVKMLNGLLMPAKGRVLIDSSATGNKSVAQLSRDVGLIFQNPDHQLFAETVSEELSFSLRNFGFPEDVIQRRVTSILESLDLRKYSNTSPFILSGGERKRVALAATLVWNPKHIIMDEPTIGQDYLQKDRLRNFIVQLISQGKTIIIVTHDVEFVAECNPRVVLLSKGRILADGPATRILTRSDLVTKASLVRPQITELMQRLKEKGTPADIVEPYAARDFLTPKLHAAADAQTSTR
ncbi:MAG TPA: ABC transporter ATP-binding protein [Candidatus Bathyarchaeia archaeon]|nr:ABC transporter ATP-binding protein [Candidatus Bathyarchaeia archaeon]